jgi:hypothetical protein
MIEQLIIEYLRAELPEEKISAEVPEGMPDRFITVEKTGSQQIGRGLFVSTLAVQSWETSKMKAAVLSNKVCSILRGAPDHVSDITQASGSDYDFTDTATKRYRYQAVFTFTHY